jgi:acetolactate synthase I/II/III large subunit
MTVADAIAERLVRLGIRHVFGVGGANIEDMFAAIQRRRPRIQVVLGKHEHSAGTAADGYSRAGGGLGVVMTTSGGGAMNLVHALAEARASRVPLLAIVGEPPTEHQGRGAFQDTSGKGGAVDAAEVFRAVAPFVARLDAVRELPSLLERALAATVAPQPGPAVILIAKDLQRAEVGPPAASPGPADRPMQGPEPSRPAIAAAAALLKQRRTLIVAGPEVTREDARGELLRLVDGLGAPVAVAPDARDAFDNRDPRFRGVAGAMGHAAVAGALAEAEVVLLAGTRMPLLARMGLEPLLSDKVVVSVGSETPFVHGRQRVDLIGPLRAVLSALVEELGPPGDRSARPPSPAERPAAGASRAASVMTALQRALPDGSVVLVDAGNTGAWAVHHLAAPPGGRWLLAMGMAGMGYSFGAAIGAALATGRRCVVLAGDGAFFMHGLEIHTAVEHTLPITYLLLDNRAHGMCLVRERLLLKDDGGYNTFGPSRLGAGLGAMFPRLPAWDCPDLETLESALARAFEVPGPAVVCAQLPEVEVPPFLAFRQPPPAGGERR